MDVLISCLCLPLFLLSSTITTCPGRKPRLSLSKPLYVRWPASPPRNRGREGAGGAPRGTRSWGPRGGTHTNAKWSSLGTQACLTCQLLPHPPNCGVPGPLQIICRELQAYLPACVCVLALCSMFLRGLLLSLFLSRSWLSALWEKQTTDRLVLNQHSVHLSESRRGATVRSSPHAVTTLVCHQSLTVTQRPLGLSESMYAYRVTSSSKSILPISCPCCGHQ